MSEGMSYKVFKVLGDHISNDIEPEDVNGLKSRRRLVAQYTVPKDMVDELVDDDDDFDPLADRVKKKTIADRETSYQKRRFNRELSPERGQTENGEVDESRRYEEIMEERELEREEKRVTELIARKKQEEAESEGATIDGDRTPPPGDRTPPPEDTTPPPEPARKRRWDVGPADIKESTRVGVKKSRWDQPPNEVASMVKVRKSRWDQHPGPQTETPTIASPEEEEDSVKSLFTNELLDKLLPSDGYVIATPPANYVPIRITAHKLLSDPSNSGGTNGFVMLEDNSALAMAEASKELPTEISGIGELQYFKESDRKHFSKLLETTDPNSLSVDELKERKVMKLLLKIKNGAPPVRKSALRQFTDQAKYFGPKILFNQILPLLMEGSLEDQERHNLVKVIDRVLYKLGDLIRPYTHKILVVIEPLLIDEDLYARAEGREIISNLSKAAGLAHMIATMRPDIDHDDEYVRNATARSFAIVASTLGIPSLLPFLKAVCHSKKSWQARHTGVKIVQQIAILMGCSILPHLEGLVSCIGDGLTDQELKVRMITALALSSLAEAATPYGIESFEQILQPLWSGVRRHRGKGLAAFIRCIGFIIPLMDPEYANFYTREVMNILLREFNSPDEEMKKTVLKVIQQCAGTEGITPQYLREEVLPPFFKNFWVRRLALDRRNFRLVVDTTVELAQKVGGAEIIERIVDILKDESEPFRKMAVETVDKVISSLDANDISGRTEERLVDGILTAFQEQTVEDPVILNGFGTTVNALGYRTKPYIPQIVSSILFRLSNQSPAIRQQSADLIARIAVVMKKCDEDVLMGKLGQILYEQLGEEYPDVLGSILGALRSIVAVVGLNSMQPPIRDLLPRLTPILRNRHEKVQENAIDLVGRIADRGSEFVSAREWMRICFELLDMLKAPRKSIRRAANNTFGYIAKAIGPQDVLATLLSNLRVQERQSRVCTAVAIGIVAETCAPFTVLPALMNEYRVPELNVQHGVLKSMTFMFEYVGDMAKDYIYAVVPLIEDALTERDLVHRQTAATVVKHLALGCVGLGCEDAMIHFLNLIFPNIFVTSPHVINRLLEGIDGLRNSLGVGVTMNYIWAGLFQAAKKVRTPYWRMYNSAYVQSADAIVPYYPELEEPEYHRHELDIWI
ncbi:Hsh155p [Sugiyamaella lignohabitans]|uniref:Hsh155p n=1 Tax=Sugiyamaella lignohabitans TaxID=796027 RepID=A0A161HK89_9ASCO|nr:Hsh155p [Sugiyamaella lignohabitans]ANB13347.1 Hsh155p [Sugiyamaella lignohabitans]